MLTARWPGVPSIPTTGTGRRTGVGTVCDGSGQTSLLPRAPCTGRPQHMAAPEVVASAMIPQLCHQAPVSICARTGTPSITNMGTTSLLLVRFA